jgi:hypothetical protein
MRLHTSFSALDAVTPNALRPRAFQNDCLSWSNFFVWTAMGVAIGIVVGIGVAMGVAMGVAIGIGVLSWCSFQACVQLL